MELYVRCECGWECVAARDELIKQVRAHGSAVHGIELDDAQALAVARPYVQSPGVSRVDEETGRSP